jgi:hypothetical protein
MAVAAELSRGVSFIYLCVLFVAAPLAAAAVVARRLADARRGSRASAGPSRSRHPGSRDRADPSSRAVRAVPRGWSRRRWGH